MGLSSSQGRLLMLTSRISDIQLQQIMISQRQNRLAWDQEKIAKEYSDAMSNYKLEIRMPDSTYENTSYSNKPVNYDNLSAMGYIICDAQGNIYLPQNEDGTFTSPKDLYGNDLLQLTTDTETNKTSAVILESMTYSREEIKKLKEQIPVWQKQLETATDETAKAAIQKQIDDANTKIAAYEQEKLSPTTGPYNVVDGKDMIKDSEILQQQIMNGQLYVINTNDSKPGLTPELLESDTNVMWVLDTSDDAVAESVYNYETAQLERKENQLELELKQLETQHEALMKEYESVEKVISNNIERTFKLFSSG